jgi:purine-binding chemotaxis protein CheW
VNATRGAEAAAVHLLVLELDGLRFALPAPVVQRVVRAVTIHALPKAPPIVEGAINVHGAIVPVLDVRQRFRLPAVPLHPDQHFVIATAGSRLVALRVDRATDLLAVDRAAIDAAEATIPGVEYVAGIATLDDGLLVIHDLERFLALDEARTLDAALPIPVEEPVRPAASPSAP